MYSCTFGKGWVGRGCLYFIGMSVLWYECSLVVFACESLQGLFVLYKYECSLVVFACESLQGLFVLYKYECSLVVFACESLHVCAVYTWRCEHAFVSVEVVCAVYKFPFIHSCTSAGTSKMYVSTT